MSSNIFKRKAIEIPEITYQASWKSILHNLKSFLCRVKNFEKTIRKKQYLSSVSILQLYVYD
jgi:hypothetical protein